MSGSQQNRRNRVLLIDGDHRSSNRLACLLNDDGFEVDVVRDGAAALARLARAPLPDALVTELSVPFVDGASIARFARAERPGVQIVILTRHPHSLREGALGPGPPPLVLTKPLEYGQLLAALQALPQQPETEQASLAATRDRRPSFPATPAPRKLTG